MPDFDNTNRAYQHQFIRQNSAMLKSIYGTTEVEPYWIADMDFQVAEPVTAELQRLVDRGRYAYEMVGDEVFNALTNWFQRRHQLGLNPQRFIMAPGVLSAMSLIVRELTNEGDKVLTQIPVYHQFRKLINNANRTLITNALINDERPDGKNGYRMDFADLEQKFADGVKVMILCNPHNPVGRVWKAQELNRVLELADKYNVTIISDEIHADILLHNNRFTSLVSLLQQQDKPGKHIALLGSPAKTFGMQGIATGFIYIEDQALHKRFNNLLESMYLNHGNALSSYATIAAFTHGDAWLDQMLAYLENSLSWITDFIEKELPGVLLSQPEGTYQIWLNFEHSGFSAEQVKQALVAAGMGLSPGGWFQSDNDFYFRMNIAAPLTPIQQGFQQLKQQLSAKAID